MIVEDVRVSRIRGVRGGKEAQGGHALSGDFVIGVVSNVAGEDVTTICLSGSQYLCLA